MSELGRLRALLANTPRCSAARHAGEAAPPATWAIPGREGRLCDACAGELYALGPRELPYAAEVRRVLRLLAAIDQP